MKKLLFQILILIPMLSYGSDIEYDMSYKQMDTKFDVYLIKGRGEECEVTVGKKEWIDSTTCLSLTNSKGIKILCTKKKKMCKTESEFLNFIKLSKIEKESNDNDYKHTQYTSNSIEEISTPWYNAEAPVTDVYIDTLEAFPSDYIDKNSRILCTKLSIRENSTHKNVYNISGMCQLSRDKTKVQSLNPFVIQFVSVRRIAELIMSKKRSDNSTLSGVLIKDGNDVSFSKYMFVVNSVSEPK